MHRLDHAEQPGGNYTWNVVWDTAGTAYFGRDRLWRWDGTALEPIGPERMPALRGMSFAPDGKLWLAAYNRFGEYDAERDRYVSRLDWLPEEHRRFGQAWALHHDGRFIWLGTKDTLFRLSSDSAMFWEFEAQHRVIFHFIDSEVYAQEAGVGLWRVEENAKRLINESPEVLEKSIVYLQKSKNGDIEGVSGNGIVTFGHNGDHVELSRFHFDFGFSAISAAASIKENFYILGTIGNGLLLLNKGQETIAYEKIGSGLTGKMILDVKPDQSGNIWALDESSISVIKPGFACGFIDLEKDNAAGFVTKIFKDDSSLFISSERGLLKIEDSISGKLKKLYEKPCYNINQLGEDYVFDDYDELYFLRDDIVTLLKDFDREITAFTVTEEGLIYILLGRELEAYRLLGGDRIELIDSIELSNNPLKLAGDGSGRVWGWSTWEPLTEIRLEGEELAVHEHRTVGGVNLLEEDYTLAVTEDGPLLLLDERVGRWSEENSGWEIREVRELTGSPDACYALSREDGYQLWLIDWEDGLNTYLMRRLEWKSSGELSYNRIPWPLMTELGQVTQLLVSPGSNPAYAVGGSRGIMLAGEELPSQIPRPGTPLIFQRGERDHPEGGREMEFGGQNLSFHYGLPGHTGLYPVRFQSRLVGLEEAWSEPRERMAREFGRIPKGRYRFEVRGVDPFGRHGEATSVGVTIRPPWYAQPVVYPLYGLLLTVMLLAGYRAGKWRARRREAYLEAQVNQQTSELRKANAVKDDFVATLSHEIRNPLNGVIGLIHEMKEGDILHTRSLRSLKEAADYLQETVEEVLDFSQLESGRTKVERQPVDIIRILEGVADVYREQARGMGLEFKSEIRIPSGLAVITDGRKVRQIVGNLASNAVKFTDTGWIRLEVELEKGPEETGRLRICVEDTGNGIPEADQERIFEKFYQSRTIGKPRQGTGLGLSLVKGFLELLEGSMRLDSNFETGTRFDLEIPVGIQLVPEHAADNVKPAMIEPGQRVLVVEDIEYNRNLMEDMLKGLGCEVESADRGRLGLEMARDGDFRAVFLDWDLPELNGPEIARRLRADPSFSEEIKLIGLTASATRHVRAECLASGMDYFLTKPVDRSDIIEVLNRSYQPYLLGNGKLGEMAKSRDWNSLVNRWIEITETHAGKLHEAIGEGNAEAVRKAAHGLLGHVIMLDLRDYPKLLREIQDAARTGELEHVRILQDRFEMMTHRVIKEVRMIAT